jgi:tetratricopeptide (TPR) repeat protein
MNRGLEIEDNVTLIVDLSTVYIKCFTVDAEKEDLRKAFELLNKALTKQPESANALMQLSLAKLLNEEIDEAWERFHQGYELDPDNASIEILEGLLAKKDDPRGVFKKKN